VRECVVPWQFLVLVLVVVCTGGCLVAPL
jgi:hypothetical protein